MLAFLDGDIFAFRAGFSCETKDENGNKVLTVPLPIAYARCRDMIINTLEEVGINPDYTNQYRIFLTDSNGNFRKKLCPEYKANRKDVARPQYLHALEHYLIKEWGAIRAVEQEADDMLGIYQTKCWNEHVMSVICSIDKDLKQVPGMHYNFVKCEMVEISKEQGEYNFYRQLVMGDPTDNIGGCPGIGPKKADKLLKPYFGNTLKLYEAVYEQYKKTFPELCDVELKDLIIGVGRLVYIRRHEHEMWFPPVIKEPEKQPWYKTAMIGQELLLDPLYNQTERKANQLKNPAKIIDIQHVQNSQTGTLFNIEGVWLDAGWFIGIKEE